MIKSIDDVRKYRNLDFGTGQSVAHNRDRIFLFFFCQGKDIFRHFIGVISDSRLKTLYFEHSSCIVSYMSYIYNKVSTECHI